MHSSRSDHQLLTAVRPWSASRSSSSQRDEDLQQQQQQQQQHHQLQRQQQQTSTATLDHDQRPRARKPSPGLAARLKALGFGKDTKSENRPVPSSSSERIGRIPEHQIQKLELRATSPLRIHTANRDWDNTIGYLTPQRTGGNYTDSTIKDLRASKAQARRRSSVSSVEGSIVVTANSGEGDMDPHKYRLPDHTNGNGTKAMSETKLAHIVRDIPADDEIPPPPIPKDTPPGGTTPSEFSGDASSYFNPFALQREGTIYTLSRASFSSQIERLTSLQLPDADSLSTKVSSIPSSKAASKALMSAAEQIRHWISKASEVISGLDGEDDVEWAAAGGREGLEEVDNAITRFEQLIQVYVSAIESLQERPDISSVSPEEPKKVVAQVEIILFEWEKIKKDLKNIKNSVEFAMEWEELWNTVLGDIGMEMEVLSRLVFEMEEKRHKSLMADGGDGLDLNELETIVEETPSTRSKAQVNNRFSISVGPTFPLTPNSPNQPAMAQDDSSLLALFARMQPLRASLDFLPMRLAGFNARAEDIFPAACEELEERREGLEVQWKSLEKDAETLRRELGEDRWVLVFRGAGRQALKMYESVERSVIKLREGIDGGTHLENPASMGKRIESYEAKKMHYGPAIERVLSIIEKGVKDRLTVNGEIVRLHSEMQQKWDSMKEEMCELDIALEDLQADKKNQQLRDSISSMLSDNRSTIGSQYDTPGSSPASSVVMASGLSGGLDPQTPAKDSQKRSSGQSSIPRPGRRTSSYSSTTNQVPRKGLTSRLSTLGHPSPGSSPASREDSTTPTGKRLSRPALGQSLEGRPRWNSSTNTKDTLIGHNFKPLSLTTPSPHARTKPPSVHSNRSNISMSDSKIPLRSPLSRGNTMSPAPESTPSRNSNSRLAFRDRLASPGPYSQQLLSQSSPARPATLHTRSSMSALNVNRRVSMQPRASDPMALSSKLTRPASSLAENPRHSLLPQAKARGRQDSSVTGRESPHAIAGAASAMRTSSQTSTDSKEKAKKPWK